MEDKNVLLKEDAQIGFNIELAVEKGGQAEELRMEIGVEEQQVGDECPMSTSEEVAEKLEEKGQVDKRSNAKDMQHDNLGQKDSANENISKDVFDSKTDQTAVHIGSSSTNSLLSQPHSSLVNSLPQPAQPSQPSQPILDQQPPVHTIKFTTQGLPGVIAKKIQGLVDVLNCPTINITKLKRYLSEGIPDQASIIRQYSWKIILGYLSQQRGQWSQRIAKQTQTYFQFVKLFLPTNKFQDYPLLLKKDHPRFNQLQQDFTLWQQIQKDTSRTHAQFSFFSTQCTQMLIPYLTSSRRQKFKLINGDQQISYKQFLADKTMQRKTYRYDYMTRILYIYSKLNPRIQYVQGMNEILAPIFYLVNAGKSGNAVQQASCFFMFNNAISDVIELHIKDLDRSHNGIYGKLQQVNEMLVVIQPRIWSRLEKLKIDPFFYCFRWITLLYAQDFALFDTLRIWQSIFSADNRVDFIHFFAVSIIISAKEVILNHDFTYVLEYLQDIREHIQIGEVIAIANGLYVEFKEQDFKGQARVTKGVLERREKKREKYERGRQREYENDKGKSKSKSKEKGEPGLFKRFNNFLSKLGN